MIVYRLATGLYKNDLSGTGARLLGGRWNSVGVPALYTSENISLTILEILVRVDMLSIPLDYHLLKIALPDGDDYPSIATAKLKQGWKDDLEYTQWMGDAFFKTNQSLLIKVPSAIVEEEHNYILNTKHADFKKIKLISTKKFQFDKRLVLKNE